MAKGPNSTPLVAGTSLYTLGATGVLSAWNTADGALLWREDYSASVDTSKLFCGTSMSPMLDGGSLVVQVGSDVHGGRVMALDPATGKQRWAWKGLGPGYASPLSLTVGGVRQLVTLTDGSIVGIDATNRRVALVGAVPGRLAREHRIPGVDRHPCRRVRHAARHARLRDQQRRRHVGGDAGLEES